VGRRKAFEEGASVEMQNPPISTRSAESDPPAHDDAVSLRPVTHANLDAVCALEAGDGGRQVAPNQRSMAQAAVHDEAWPRAVYAGETAVGFLMLYDPSLVPDPEEPDFVLWRMMIDRRRHGCGHGLAALRALVEHLRTRPHRGELLTSIVEPAPQLLAIYGRAGFVATDRQVDGERVLRLALPPPDRHAT
jgi:diamine N-acetyltransferase